MKINFFKYHGTGNDFVILDNRDGNYNELTEKIIHQICNRRFGIGADGLMMLGSAEGYDFSMKYFNADGKEGSMCGNGGRCLVRFAYDMGIKKEKYLFIAVDGNHEAALYTDKTISLKMVDVDGIEHLENDKILNTGSPHYVQFRNDLDSLNVFDEGRNIRYNNRFKKDGINVNFVQRLSDGIRLRTYERGVEDETLSCGTGATAAAIASSLTMGNNTVDIQVQGGKLSVSFERISPTECKNIWLTGPAEFVFNGILDTDNL